MFEEFGEILFGPGGGDSYQKDNSSDIDVIAKFLNKDAVQSCLKTVSYRYIVSGQPDNSTEMLILIDQVQAIQE